MMRLVAVLVLALHAGAAAQPRPPVLDRVRVDEHLGEQVPGDLLFTNASGRRVRLETLFDGERPTLLVLTYVRCRMLCSLVLQGTLEVVRALPLALGRDYRLVVVSIDPHEEAASAAARARELRAKAGGDVEYLVGAERPIAALADRLGFRYAWDPKTEQYAHPAVVFVLAPDGTIVRYLHGVRFEPELVADSLRRAADGERALAAAIGETVLACFLFDPAARAHRELIESYLHVGGGVMVALLVSGVGFLLLWERKRRRAA